MDPVQARKMLAEIEASAVDINHMEARLKAMIYGEKGVGKTVLGMSLLRATVGPDQDIVYVDTSEGWVALKNHPKLLEKVIVIPFVDFNYLEVLVEAIRYKQGKFANVGGIMLDEFTMMVDRDLDDQAKIRDPDAEVPEWKDYNVEKVRVRKLISYLYKTIGLHIMLCGHPKDKKNTQGAVIFTGMAFNPAVGQQVAADMHLIGHMTAKNAKTLDNTTSYTREIQVHPTAMIEAKTRVGGLPVKVDDGTLITRTLEWLKAGGEDKPAEAEMDLGKLMDAQGDDAPAFVSE